MKPNLRTQLRRAHEEIRILKNGREVTEFPLRKRVAELERDLRAAQTLIDEMRAEFYTAGVLAMSLHRGATRFATGKAALAFAIPVLDPSRST